MNSPGDSGIAGDGVKPADCPLPDPLRHFVDSCRWRFAETYADTWPHEYIVRKNVDEDLFVRLVGHIRGHGYEGRFYRMRITYFEEGGLVYWTMGSPIEETTIVNRCKKEGTYEERLRNGTLPETRKTPKSSRGQ
jgi:hypothetical protein